MAVGKSIKRREMKKDKITAVERHDIVIDDTSDKKLRRCDKCGKIPTIKLFDKKEDSWVIECGCGSKGTSVYLHYKTKDTPIALYNASFPEKLDIILTVVIRGDNILEVSCNTMDGWEERIKKARKNIVKAVSEFCK